VCHLLNCVVVD